MANVATCQIWSISNKAYRKIQSCINISLLLIVKSLKSLENLEHLRKTTDYSIDLDLGAFLKQKKQLEFLDCAFSLDQPDAFGHFK